MDPIASPAATTVAVLAPAGRHAARTLESLRIKHYYAPFWLLAVSSVGVIRREDDLRRQMNNR